MSILVGHAEVLSRIPNPVPPVLLLTGPSGVGKSIAARVLAHASGVRGSDYQRIENLTKQAALEVKRHHSMHPLDSDLRVSVIDITKAPPEGITAILTLLEDPPEHSRLILHSNTTPFLTVTSRCFGLKFGYLSDEEVAEVLRAKKVPEHIIADAARLSQGRVDVALAHAQNYGARLHAQKILRAVASQEVHEVERALRGALERQGREEKHETEEHRAVVAGLLAKSLQTTFSAENHPLAFIPEEIRQRSLQILESPARANVRVRAGVWGLVAEG